MSFAYHVLDLVFGDIPVLLGLGSFRSRQRTRTLLSGSERYRYLRMETALIDFHCMRSDASSTQDIGLCNGH